MVIEDCTKSLEQNQSMHHDWGIFWHLFGGFSKIKSRNRKNKKVYLIMVLEEEKRIADYSSLLKLVCLETPICEQL